MVNKGQRKADNVAHKRSAVLGNTRNSLPGTLSMKIQNARRVKAAHARRGGDNAPILNL